MGPFRSYSLVVVVVVVVVVVASKEDPRPISFAKGRAIVPRWLYRDFERVSYGEIVGYRLIGHSLNAFIMSGALLVLLVVASF
jgi:hypothetical protein